MVHGKALIEFGYDTVLMHSGFNKVNDELIVALLLRSREPGPLTKQEMAELEGKSLYSDDYDVMFTFKSVSSIETLLRNLQAIKEQMEFLLEKEKKKIEDNSGDVSLIDGHIDD